MEQNRTDALFLSISNGVFDVSRQSNGRPDASCHSRILIGGILRHRLATAYLRLASPDLRLQLLCTGMCGRKCVLTEGWGIEECLSLRLRSIEHWLEVMIVDAVPAATGNYTEKPLLLKYI